LVCFRRSNQCCSIFPSTPAHFCPQKEENYAREQQGLPPLPDEDLASNPLFKPLPPLSCLSSLLISSQISRYCSQVSQVCVCVCVCVCV
jgi:hypothetical protein